MSPAEIQVYAQFPRDISLEPVLDLNPTNWVWAHCLTIPLKTLQDLHLSCRPYKWIRYAIGSVVGAQGHLSSRAHSLNVVDYNAGDIHTSTNQSAITRLYYHLTDDDERRRMFPVSPEYERTLISEVLTVRMMDFYEAVAARDGDTCPVTQAKKYCLPTHLVEHSKGDEYIFTLTRARTRDPARGDVIEDIDSVRNGIFLDLLVRCGLGKALGFLLTPNFAMDTTDVDPSADSATRKQYTVHLLHTCQDARFYLSPRAPPHGSPIPFPNSDSPDWPPPILFDAVYGGAVLHTFGTKKMKGAIAESWCKAFYPSGDRTAIGDKDEEYFPHGRESDVSAEPETPDEFDMLLAAPYAFIPPERLDGYRKQVADKIDREIQRGVGRSIKSWLRNVQLNR